MSWLDIGAGAAHGLDKMLADRLAEEHWQRKQQEEERSNLATETFRGQTLKNAEENRRLQREQMLSFETARQGDRAADNLRAQIGQLPGGTEFSPVRWKEITDKGAALPERGESIVPYNEQFVGPIQPEGPQRGESVIKLRGTPTEIASERTAKATEEQRDYANHSAIYKEYQDYKREGGTLGFDAYATMDANRKKPSAATDPAIPMDQGELDMWARKVALGGDMPAMGSGKAGVDARHQIGKRASRFNTTTMQFEDDNTNPPDLAAAGADYRANRDVLTQLSKNQAAVNTFASTAKKNVGLLNETLATLPDAGIQFINSPYRDLKETFGDTTVTKFNVIQNALKNEYARLTSQPNLTGPLTVQTQNEVKEALGDGATVAQIKTAFETLAREGDNRHAAIVQEIAETRGRISPTGTPATPPAATETPEQRRQRLLNALPK